ncbi:uncharacterized protein K441DRAFT_101105 [Cenococcum geophilum 1.58]|uniref:uncharacterized protein n=1 Tax=Cenococcum geophilum 1.58 TaxID=794803 RepID=UPI00358F97A6|nr:hypothetical protein K441DRAFT_101105 [Cenococcum geophilum 1.58]
MTLLTALPTTLSTALPTALLTALPMALPTTLPITLPQLYHHYRLPPFKLFSQPYSTRTKLNTLANKITSILSLRSSKTTASEPASLSRPIPLLFQLCSAALLLNTTSPTLKILTFSRMYA